MSDTDLGMEDQLPEPVAREARLLDQALEFLVVRRVRLQREKSEDRDGVVVEDPVVLRADEGGDLRRWQLRPERCGIEAKRLEVIEDRAAGFVAVRLLGDVALQVGAEAFGDG